MNFQVRFLLCLLICLPFTSRTQDHWIDGKVVFSADSAFKGHFKFSSHVDKEIIAIKSGNRILALPPKEILSAEGIMDGEFKKWRTEEFKNEDSGFNVHLLLEEIYGGDRYSLYKKDFSFMKWSPYADILCNSLAFDSYKNLINPEALLLMDIEAEKMVVINRPNMWGSKKYMININVLSAYLDIEKRELKDLVNANDLKLDNLADMASLLQILERDQMQQQLSLSHESHNP